MKGLIMLLMTAVLWYFAGMFRQTNVMIIAVCLLVIALLMIILSIYQRIRLRVSLPEKKLIAFKGLESSIAVLAENKSLLPVNKYKITLQAKYDIDKDYVKKRFTGCAAGRKMKGDNRAEFFITPPYCGIIDIELKKLRVYDTLCLFSFGKRLNESCQMMVFPVAGNMKILCPQLGNYDAIPLSDSRSKKAGDDHSEVRLIREYRTGDLSRHIHHNYSAKTDSLWVKEYYKDNDYIFDFYLDTSSAENPSIEIWDLFYRITCTVIISLLRNGIFLHVHWFDKSRGCLVETEINSESDCPEFFMQLYTTDKSCTKDEFYNDIDPEASGTMFLNLDLEWFFSGKPVHRFDPLTAEAELSEAVFSL